MNSTILALLNRFPWLKKTIKRVVNAWLPNASVSSGYVELSESNRGEEATRLRDSWQSGNLPKRQRELVDRQLAAYAQGESVGVYDMLCDALENLPVPVKGMTLLEVGCSSGFYSEVFKIKELEVEYSGCDYSKAFIDLARETYPSLSFEVEDATALRYPDHAFDIVVSGCCILHIPDYERAVAETARVASQFAIFHRTPMVIGESNKFFKKLAYGVETIEIHFNEPDFLELLARHGLELLHTYTLNESIHKGVGSANRTYVCQKKP